MTDPFVAPEALEHIPTPILRLVWKLVRRAVLRVRVTWADHRGRRHPIMNPKQAHDLAYALLGGRVLKAQAFRNVGSEHALLAVLRSTPELPSMSRVHVLEQFGGNWRQIFQGDDLYGMEAQDSFSIEDLDRDGQKEIICASASRGSGFCTKCLYMYIPTRGKTYKVRAGYNWCAPGKPQVTLSAEPDPRDETDRKWLKLLEVRAETSQVIERMPHVDLDDAKYAVQRWHHDNGGLESGQVQIHTYAGRPIYAASVADTLEDGDITWTAYFKGPVYGYARPQSQHFVVYSPAWSYNWAHCLLADDRFLWIGTGGKGILRYDKRQRCLKKIVLTHEGKELLSIESMERANDRFVINGRAEFDAAAMTS